MKNKPTPPAPQNSLKRLTFFRQHKDEYSPEKYEYEMHRCGGITKQESKIIKSMKSEVSLWTPAPNVLAKLQAWVGNKFRPENRRLGMRGA